MKRNKPKRSLSDYFFTYSWGDLEAVRHLRNTWVMVYASIAAAGYVLNPLDDAARSALLLGALANYPGFLIGLRSQRFEKPSALESEELMVWRIGLVAMIFSGVGMLFLLQHFLF